jgi:hypothetical protein
VTDLVDWLTDPTVEAPPTGLLPDYAFRYMGNDGLLATIATRGLRMNAWSKMNDPREAQQWESTGTLTAVAPFSEREMRQRLNDVLRRSARLLALTVDRNRTPDADPNSLFHRGWGRAPLWAHYADSHRGVCLVLDPAAVNEAFDNGVPVKSARHRLWGRIHYADKPIRIDLAGAFADQASLDAAIKDYIDQHLQKSRGGFGRLYMSKNTDWAYETELRIAVVDRDLDESELDTPVNIPLGDLLTAVIFGDAHSAPSVIAAGVRHELGPDSPQFFQCHWTNGAPRLEQLAI